MSAMPERFMGAPDNPGHDDEADLRQDEDAGSTDEAGDDFSQWVALVVLLACWLAEAYM